MPCCKDDEVRLGESTCVAQWEWFAVDASPLPAPLFDMLISQIATVDVQLINAAASFEQVRRSGALGLIGGRQSDGADDPSPQLHGNVALVPINALLLALAPMAHIGVADANLSVFGHTLLDALVTVIGVRFVSCSMSFCTSAQCSAKGGWLNS